MTKHNSDQQPMQNTTCSPSPDQVKNDRSDNSVESEQLSPTTGKKRAIEEIDVKDDDTSTTSCSTPTPTQQQPQPRKQRRPRKAPHELLSEAEKKANHIASEQKRRQNIRLGFEQLIEVVPALSQGNRSEALILQKSVEHIRNLVSTKNDLKNQVRSLQEQLGEPSYDDDSSEDELAYSVLGR
ncbi:hypothetical protein LRAMOSA06483 [Lichtheimia ramosa]|uniref:BHLH domain-containing protein n=1 Tax=Lichtheimia ramosa TaxID=688394 RepID=A0A077X4R1_9FUNG|nr:hypothetical protein LRAMOSA06483 [Lichtheimia ramosa]